MKRLVAVALLLQLGQVASPAAAVDADRAEASWDGLDVPYIQVKDARQRRLARLRFHDTRVTYPFLQYGIFSMAATADSAIAMEWRYGGEGDDIEGPLLEVSADGTTGTVERRAAGIPLADPLGHTAFWTKRDGRGTRLIGYDTFTHHKIRGPLLRRFARVFAVEGETAYVMAFRPSTAPAGLLSWTPGEPVVTSIPLPPPSDTSDPDAGRLLIDVADGQFLTSDYDDGSALWSDAEGNVLSTAPRAGFGGLSPDARYLAASGDRQVAVLDLDTEELVVPQLPARLKAVGFRWAPDGRIVLFTTPRGGYDDAKAVYRFVCTLPDGACRRLPGRSARFYEDGVDSSSWGQLITLLIPIGSRTATGAPKAPERYFRQR